MDIEYECRHAFYSVNKFNNSDDYIFIKLLKHNPDGTSEIVKTGVENYKVPYWVTKEGFRTYEQTKEYETFDRLDKHSSNYRQLPKNSCQMVNRPNFKNDTMTMLNNPYIYGVGITPTSIIKNSFLSKSEKFTNYTVAVLDTETDMIYGTDEIVLISITMKNKAVIVATRFFLEGPVWAMDKYKPYYKDRLKVGWEKEPFIKIENYEELVKAKFIETRSDANRDRVDDFEVHIVDTPLDAIKLVIGKAHEWMPDFLTGWNFDFDIQKMFDNIDHFGGDAGDIFSDPTVPKPYRNATYVKGMNTKVTESNKETPLAWYDQYHVVHTPASFFFICQACVFRRERLGAGVEPSMALDAILRKYTKVKKLEFTKYENLTKAEQHHAMQKYEKVLYSVYCVDDCIGCEVLDEQEFMQDLALSVLSALRNIDFNIYNSQPKRLVTDFHHFCLSRNAVLGAKGRNFILDLDSETMGIDNIIVTLPSHMVPYRKNDLVVNTDNYNLIFKTVYDLDVTGAYPEGEDKMNTSRSTTIAEIISIGDLSKAETIELTLNLTAIDANAVEIGMLVLNGPSIQDVLDDYAQYELGK
jgi:hypothetical protein